MVLTQTIALWLVSTLIGVIAFPLLYTICPRLKDRGYAIARVTGLVFVTFIAWFLSSIKVLPFGTGSLLLALICLLGLSLRLGYGRRKELFSFLKENSRLILLIEVIGIVFLIVFLFIVSLNPNIDPDSERFMDYALLNSIDRTAYFPPLDPWFSGRVMDYYYYGYIIVSGLHKLVPVPLPVFFNLVLAQIYALFVMACFGIGYNLTGKRSYGLLAVCGVMLIGNLDGLIQIFGKGFTNFGAFHSARVLVQETADGRILDYPINEFPFFSLIYGDLHPYVITYLINMAILNLLLNLALVPAAGWRMLGETRGLRLLTVIVISIMIGCLFGAHTWDYPVYLAVIVALLAYHQWREFRKAGKETIPEEAEGGKEGEEWPGRAGLTAIIRFLGPAVTLVLVSFIIYLPFNLSFISEQVGHERGGIGMVSLRTPLGLFLIAFGIYLFFLVVFLLSHASAANIRGGKKISWGPFSLFLLAAVAVIARQGGGSMLDQTYLFLAVLFILTAVVLFFPPLKEEEHFSLILALIALGLAFFCEFFFMIDHYQGGGYERMNTMFKLYTNVWLLLGTTAVYGIFFINQLLQKRPDLRFSWKILVLLFLSAGLFFPVGAVGERIRGLRQPLTLDGVAYLSRPNPTGNRKEWRWDQDDWRAIKWINQNISGQPVLLEAGNMTNQDGGESQAYHWASRVATFTGLPILVGWANHEAGWRNDWKEPGQRKSDTDLLFRTTNINTAINLLNKYDIQYVFIGSVERDRYPEEGLRKFSELGKLVYREGPVEIWKVGSDRTSNR